MKFVVLPSLAIAASLAACSPNSQNETAEAGNAIAADASATTTNAVDDVDAATDRALYDAGTAMDNAGERMGSRTERADDAIDRGADRAGDAIANGADRAAAVTGRALRDAGNSVDK